MKVLIKGGAGFTRTHITDELLKEKYEIVDNLVTGKERITPQVINYYQEAIQSKNLIKLGK
jgi:UDP-glucose 4-epimerase